MAGERVSVDALEMPLALPPGWLADLGVEREHPAFQSFLPAAPTGMRKLFGKARHERAVAAGMTAYVEACRQHERAERHRVRALAAARKSYERAVSVLT